MQIEVVVALVAVVALLLGIVIATWFHGRSSASALDAALARHGAQLQTDLATAQADLRQTNQSLDARAAELRAAREESEAARREREVARNETAALTARVTHLTQVEEELTAERQRVTQAVAQGATLREELADVRSRLSAELKTADELRESLRVERERHATLGTEHATSQTRLSVLEQQLETERQAAAEKLQLLDGARQALADQFKLVAAEIMEANAVRFAEQSQQNLGTVLDPLRTRLQEFQQKVEEVYVNEGKDRAALKDQVQRLVELNNQLSQDATNLTNALRGSNKAQGNWGELILQRILEDAGLREGVEFVLQDSQTSDDGRRQQPDVVIQLPEGRKIVVDAKVSLLAFERSTSATTDDEKTAALREHVTSLRAHIKGLSDREYTRLYGTTLDFVVMFVPIEPAFMLAVAHDERLCADAWSRNVLLVSPSTLLFVLRTVAYLWRQEAQSRNAKEIADRGGQLYDKLAAFVTDLEAVGGKLDAAKQSYTDAHRKLSSGKGSAIRQAEMLKELGVKPTKAMPRRALELTGSDDQPALESGEEAQRDRVIIVAESPGDNVS